jgi:hypothetical protein
MVGSDVIFEFVEKNSIWTEPSQEEHMPAIMMIIGMQTAISVSIQTSLKTDMLELFFGSFLFLLVGVGDSVEDFVEAISFKIKNTNTSDRFPPYLTHHVEGP